MKSVLIPKKIILFYLLCSLSHYMHAHTATKETTTHHEENKTTKKKNNGGFVWKFSAGFVTGIAVMHIAQKTLMRGTILSNKLCIYTQLRNVLTK